MNKAKELKIDNTLWAAPSKIINLLDFKPDEISIKTENYTNNNIKIHHVRYENGGFYLVIDNLKGYFEGYLEHLSMLFVNNDQHNKYYQVWKEILTINGDHGKIVLHKEIRIFDNELPIGYVFKIYSITIVIKSLIEKNNIFYPEIALNHCLY